MRARRVTRNSRTSVLWSTPSTVRPDPRAREVLPIPGTPLTPSMGELRVAWMARHPRHPRHPPWRTSFHASSIHVRRRRRSDRDRARPRDHAADRRRRAHRALLHLRQRPAPVPQPAVDPRRNPDGPRVHRRRRGGRLGRGDPHARRLRDRPVRLVGRHLRLLPRGAADLVPSRRVLGRQRDRRRPGRGGTRAAGRRHPREGAGRRRRVALPVPAHPVRRVRHRLPRRRSRAA